MIKEFHKLNKELTNWEVNDIIRTIHGELCRVCVSDDKEEIVTMLGFAMQNVSSLAQNQFIKIDKKN